MMIFDESFPSLTPIHFFSIEAEVKRLAPGAAPRYISEKAMGEFLLPSTASLCHEEPFAQVAMGWDTAGIAVSILVKQPVERVSYPDLVRCDSVELFFDTRDLKTGGLPTRFSHHFFFLPKPYESHLLGEITRFRTEDAHPHCSADEIYFSPHIGKDHYFLQIFLPAQVLVGYQPEEFSRLGFTYRINRPQGMSQHFAAVTEEYPFEGQPSTWARLYLKE